jgi:hypothetical protein
LSIPRSVLRLQLLLGCNRLMTTKDVYLVERKN